ncbi:peptidase, M23/M37 family [Peptoniphilus sp. ING2-D1G]|nr:peptidase, M23/M37 family [Peptoniphilus sp. ING2-D1G]
MKKYRLSIICLVVALLLPLTVYGGSADLEKKQQQKINEKNKVSKQLEKNKMQLVDIEGDVAQVNSEISVLDGKINSLSSNISELESEIERLNKEIVQTQKELDEAELNLQEKKEQFETRLRAMYMNGKASYLEVILNSKNMEELLRNNEIIVSISNADKELVEYITEQVRIIEEKSAKLESDKNTLAIAKSSLEIEKAEQQKISAEKRDYMNALMSDAEAYRIEYEKAEAQWRSLDKEILRLQSQIKELKEQERIEREKAQKNQSAKVSARSSGALLWPVPGNTSISSGYGNRMHPILKTYRFHSGIDIPASSGTSVVAVKSGIVIMSRNMGGYGNVVMIDHGDIVTVYAHNSSLKVSAGQSVNAGDVIATVGSTGLSTGPHLHFEVRVNGQAVNPLGYV